MNKITIHAKGNFWTLGSDVACRPRPASSSHQVVSAKAFAHYKCSAWETKCKQCEQLVK